VADLMVGLDLAALVLLLNNFDMATVATVCFLLVLRTPPLRWHLSTLII